MYFTCLRTETHRARATRTVHHPAQFAPDTPRSFHLSSTVSPPPPCCLHLNPLLELHTLRNPRTIPPRTTPTVSFNPTSSSFNHTSIPHVHRATGALSPPLTFPSSLLLSPTSPRLPPPPLVFIVLRSTISSGCAPHSLRPPPHSLFSTPFPPFPSHLSPPLKSRTPASNRSPPGSVGRRWQVTTTSSNRK